ncbi:MAG: adenylate cyclase [Azospira oryzae]|nr:MAG: adenylate cyclase [Azospira oryzae]PZP80402.1 MAG: adenylate cyclase [Azospira oryzae]
MGFFKHMLGNLMGGHHGSYRGGHHGGHGYGGYPGYPQGGGPGGGNPCPQCGSANTAEARFCQQCGASLLPAKCAGCGAELAAGAKFCGQCGKPRQ